MKKNKLNILILFLLTLLVLFFVLKDDFNDILSILFNIKIYHILFILLIILISDLVKALVFYNSCIANNIKHKYIECLKVIVISHFFDGITPFASGGQAYQVFKLKNENINYSKGIGLIFYNFTTFQIAFMFLSLLSVIVNKVFNLFIVPLFMKKILIIGLIINLIVTIFVCIIFIRKKKNTVLIDKILKFLVKIKLIGENRYNKILVQFKSITNALMNTKKDFCSVTKTVLLNIFFLVLFYLIPFFVFKSLGIANINIFISLIVYFHVSIVSIYVPMPGAIVGFELAFLTLYGVFIEGALLKAGMLLWRFLTYYLLMIVGFILFLIKKKES